MTGTGVKRVLVGVAPAVSVALGKAALASVAMGSGALATVVALTVGGLV